MVFPLQMCLKKKKRCLPFSFETFKKKIIQKGKCACSFQKWIRVCAPCLRGRPADLGTDIAVQFFQHCALKQATSVDPGRLSVSPL